MLKRFSIWLIKNIIIILIAALIFSYASIDFPDVIKGVFGDVFDYASPAAQREAVGKLAETCASLEPDSNIVSMQELCSNASMMQEMNNDCNEYRRLKYQGVEIKNEQQMEENCAQIDSGEIEKSCQKIKLGTLKMDFERIGVLCKDFNSGKINDKEFFYNFVGGSLRNSSEQAGPSKTGIFGKYNNFIGYLNKN